MFLIKEPAPFRNTRGEIMARALTVLQAARFNVLRKDGLSRRHGKRPESSS